MASKVEEYIKHRGIIFLNIEKLKNDPNGYIQGLADFYIDIDIIIRGCFENDSLFKHTRDRAFSEILNSF